MVKNTKPLGRGLGSLLPNTSVRISEIEITKIIPNPTQPRVDFDEEALKELSQSIAKLGLIQPITVREMADGKYMIISGERRYRASKMAGLTSVPAYIRKADDAQMLEMALVENIQREDLNAIEIAQSYSRLIDELNLNQEELADRVGKKRSTVANYLRLLSLGPDVQVAVIEGKISMGHARALLSLENNQEEQLNALDKIISESLSVRDTEDLVARILGPKGDRSGNKKNPYRSLAKQLSSSVGLNVKITAGRVAISFKNDDELEKIKSLLTK